MASYRKRGNKWYAEIRRKGHDPRFATFATKAQAVAWAAKVENEIINDKIGKIPDKSFADLLTKYAEDVSPTKKGARWEQIRLAAIKEMDVGKVMLPELSTAHFAKWRDDRLKAVSAGTVNREWNLLSNACNRAVNEWKWLTVNPMKTVKRPPQPKARDRRISDHELERILYACGYDYEATPQTAYARVGAAFLFAIETAMRAGEIVGLTKNDVNLDARVAKLRDTKNGTSRNVPLSTEAIRLLRQLPESDPVFGLASSTLDALFRKAKSAALITDLTFHDSRHEAITRLAKKLDVLDLARMVGHRDLKMLMVYYNESAEDLAKKLY